jgi:hypothetical protein
MHGAVVEGGEDGEGTPRFATIDATDGGEFVAFAGDVHREQVTENEPIAGVSVKVLPPPPKSPG